MIRLFMSSSAPETSAFRWRDIFRALWFFLEGHRAAFVFWTTTLFLVFFYPILPPLVIGKIIDFFTHYHPGDSLRVFYLYSIGLGVTYGIASLIRLTGKKHLGDLEAEATYCAKVKGFERLLDFSLSWHDQENTGNKIQRIQKGIEAITGMRTLMSEEGFKTLSTIAGVTVAFLFLKPALVLFLLFYFSIFLSIHASFYRRTRKMHQTYNAAKEGASGTYYEGLSNVLTIKTLGVKDDFKKTIDDREQQSKKWNYALRNLGINKWKLFQLFNGISIVGYLLFVGKEVAAGALTVGSIFIFYSYLLRLIEAAGDSTDLIDHCIEYRVAFARMMPIYWDDEIRKDGRLPFPKNWKTLSIKNGNFGYGKKAQGHEVGLALHDLDLIIHRYEKIGIAGTSGGGKSTLAKLLLGLYDLESGTFTIDATPFKAIKHAALTQEIGIVLQESEMFNMTLRENVTLLRKGSTKLLEQAMEIAQLRPLLDKLPQGMETLIGEKGYRLSGGERQRVGIARAIFKDPQILVLDEATSALDSATEARIQQALEQHLKRKTVITIAHRISTLKQVDRLFVFEGGMIVEEGRYHELLQNSRSAFSKVYQARVPS